VAWEQQDEAPTIWLRFCCDSCCWPLLAGAGALPVDGGLPLTTPFTKGAVVGVGRGCPFGATLPLRGAPGLGALCPDIMIQRSCDREKNDESAIQRGNKEVWRISTTQVVVNIIENERSHELILDALCRAANHTLAYLKTSGSTYPP